MTQNNIDNNVIKCYMDFFDIIFPLNLGVLTYSCDIKSARNIKPGMIVSAPLKKKTFKGIVIRRSSYVPSKDVKSIQEVHGEIPLLSTNMIALLEWMSEYYLAEQGLVFKSMLPKEALTKIIRRKAAAEHPVKSNLKILDVNPDETRDVMESINKHHYRTFLLHSTGSEYERSFLIKLLSDVRNAIVIVPELTFVHSLYPLLQENFGDRVCPYHSGLSRTKRIDAIERILSGSSDIVFGTRSAVFAPLKEVSLIAVLYEQSFSYKQESSPCYNARDIAVMRGYFEKSTVLLSSLCPSFESIFNCRIGKYTLLRPVGSGKKPKIRIVDMRYEKLYSPHLSISVIDASEKYMKNNRKILFIVNRRGYSSLLQCMDCNHIEECPVCRIPLVFHKHDMTLKCHYCGYTVSPVIEKCKKCHGYNIAMRGAGTQRIQEDIEKLLGIKTIRFDSDRARKKAEIEKVLGDILSDGSMIVIGTKIVTRRVGSAGGFSMAAALNPDLSLNIPDFRSAEKAFQEFATVIDKIDFDGMIYIQTRMPQHYLYKYLKNYDYTSFFKEELSRRKALHYPPYSRLMLIKFVSKRDFSKELSEFIDKTRSIIPPHHPLVQNTFVKGGREDYKIKSSDEDIEIIGPHISKTKKKENEFKLLLKSSVRGSLHAAARSFIEAFKDYKDVKIRVDVDPIAI